MRIAAGHRRARGMLVEGFASPYAKVIILLSLITSQLLLPSPGLCQESEASRKLALKAAFLFYVSAQVDDAITGEKMASIFPTLAIGKRICVVGGQELFTHLKEQLKRHVVNGRHFEIVHSPELDFSVLRGCSLTYVDGCSSPASLTSSLSSLRDEGVATLTVGTGEKFLASGGMMQLYIQSNRLKFQVNTEAITRAKIKLPEEVLSLASTPGKDDVDFCP